jgi:DHA2 family multidrug resistance protein
MKPLSLSENINYKWVATFIVMIGVFMTLLDTTIVNITLPKMMAELNTDTLGIQWVVISYLIGSAIFMTMTAWLGAAIGHRYTYILGLTLFTSMSALCGQAWNLESMNTARFIQGIGEGIVVVIGLTILFEVFPEDEKGLAIGIYGLGASFAPALGPTLGGYLTEHLSWRWIFYVNLPVGLLGLLLSLAFLKESRPAEERLWRFDWMGFSMMAFMFSCLITFLAKGQEKEWLHSDFILTLIVFFGLSLAAYLFWEGRSKAPLIDLRLFKDPVFSVCVLIIVLGSMAAYGVFFLLPLYLMQLRLYPTSMAGLLMLPGSLAAGVGVVIGGVLSDRWRAKPILLIGTIGLAWTSFHLSTLDLYTPKEIFLFDFILWGGMSGLFFAPAMAMALSRLPTERVNMGSSIQNSLRLVAGSIGTSVAVTILARKSAYHFEALSAKLTYDNIAFKQLFPKFSSYLIGKGGSVVDKQALAVAEMTIQQTATSYAFQSCFIYLSLFALLGAILVLFIREPCTVKKR